MAVVTVVLAAHVDGQGYNQPESYWEMVNPPEKTPDLCAAQLFASSEVAVSEVEKFLGVTHLAMTHPPNMDDFNDLVWSEILWSQKLL